MILNRAAGPAWQGRRGPRERSPRASREEPRHSGLHEQMPLRSCLNPRILNLRPPGQQSPACPLPRTTHQAGWGWAAWPRPGRGRRQGALRRAGRRPGHAAGPGRVGTCETRAGGPGEREPFIRAGLLGLLLPPHPPPGPAALDPRPPRVMPPPFANHRLGRGRNETRRRGGASGPAGSPPPAGGGSLGLWGRHSRPELCPGRWRRPGDTRAQQCPRLTPGVLGTGWAPGQTGQVSRQPWPRLPPQQAPCSSLSQAGPPRDPEAGGGSLSPHPRGSRGRGSQEDPGPGEVPGRLERHGAADATTRGLCSVGHTGGCRGLWGARVSSTDLSPSPVTLRAQHRRWGGHLPADMPRSCLDTAQEARMLRVSGWARGLTQLRAPPPAPRPPGQPLQGRGCSCRLAFQA